jgi:selenide,water dikinase
VDLSALPVIDGAWDMLNQGIAPGATRRNLEYYGDRVQWDVSVTDVQKKLVGDPQTSGGLLLAVAPERSAALVEALQAAGSLASAVVGTLTDLPGVRVG